MSSFIASVFGSSSGDVVTAVPILTGESSGSCSSLIASVIVFLNPGIISKQADVLVVVLEVLLGAVTAGGGGGAVAAKSFSIFFISTSTASSSGSGMRIVRSSLRKDAASENPAPDRSFSSHSSVGSESEYSTMRMEGVVCRGFRAILLGFWGKPEESM